MGNFAHDEGAAFFKSLLLRSDSSDTLLLSMDHRNNTCQIEKAYSDPKGITHLKNSLKSIGHTLGNEHLFDEDKWKYFGKYNKELSKLGFCVRLRQC